jgi:hypothetical protein
MPQSVSGDFPECSRQLDSGRPPADDDERQIRAPFAEIGFSLRRLEGQKNPPADLRRVFDGFEAGSERLPMLVAEVMMARAGADDQRIVADRAVAEHDLPRAHVDVDRIA